MTTYPLNDIEYTAEDAELYNSTRNSGVYAIDSFECSVNGADNNITIGTGIGWIKNSEFSGKVIAQKESVTIDMGLPDSNYPRIDAVVIKFDANENGTSIIIKKGVPSTNPVVPEVIKSESVYELHLYHVLREAGKLSISASDVTDLRLNESYCGLMADAVTRIDTNQIEQQISGLIDYLRNEISDVKNGSAFLLRDGSVGMTGNLSMDGKKIENLSNPENDFDAVPLGYVNERFAPAIESTDYPGCYYRTVNGVTEWINPPMKSGTVYRTTERWHEKVVYAVRAYFGALPNAATGYNAIGVIKATYPDISFVGMQFVVTEGNRRYFNPKSISAGSLSYFLFDNNVQWTLGVTTTANLSAATGVVTVKFVVN